MNLIIQIFTYQYNVRVLHKYIQFRKVLLVTKTFFRKFVNSKKSSPNLSTSIETVDAVVGGRGERKE